MRTEDFVNKCFNEMSPMMKAGCAHDAVQCIRRVLGEAKEVFTDVELRSLRRASDIEDIRKLFELGIIKKEDFVQSELDDVIRNNAKRIAEQLGNYSNGNERLSKVFDEWFSGNNAYRPRTEDEIASCSASKRTRWNQWPLLALHSEHLVAALDNGKPSVAYYESGLRVGKVDPGGSFLTEKEIGFDEVYPKAQRSRALAELDDTFDFKSRDCPFRGVDRFAFRDNNGKLFTMHRVNEYGLIVTDEHGIVVGRVSKVGDNQYNYELTPMTLKLCSETSKLQTQALRFAKFADRYICTDRMPEFIERNLVEIPGFSGWTIGVDAARNEFVILNQGRLVGEIGQNIASATHIIGCANPEVVVEAARAVIREKFFGAIA